VVVALEEIGTQVISGNVQDTLGNPLKGAKVAAYRTSDLMATYVAYSDSRGDYAIPLPKWAPGAGWAVLGSLENYVPRLLEGQIAGPGIDFVGSYGEGSGLQKKTTIHVADPVVAGTKVSLEIRANPSITDQNQVAVELTSGSMGALGAPVYQANSVLIDYDSGNLDDFTITIRADTSEDNNPSQGYFSSLAFTYAPGAESAQVYLDQSGCTAKHEDTVDGQVCEVEIPPGGFAKEGTILIRKLLKTSDSSSTLASPTYVYEVKVLDGKTGLPLADADISRVEITIPIDLSIVFPGDLESERQVIHKAETMISLESNQGVGLPASHILRTDYIGNGQVGSVTFWVDSLSVFGVGPGTGNNSGSGNGSGTAGGTTSLSAAGGGGGGCFISTAGRLE
jgi:hypothetical protein